MNARVAYLSFKSPLKFLKLLKTFVASCFSTFSVPAIFLIQGCYRASEADILLLGSYVSNLRAKSFASSLTSSHSGSILNS
jgi:hypothetical protein